VLSEVSYPYTSIVGYYIHTTLPLSCKSSLDLGSFI
jgi:hypothetical protein